MEKNKKKKKRGSSYYSEGSKTKKEQQLAKDDEVDPKEREDRLVKYMEKKHGKKATDKDRKDIRDSIESDGDYHRHIEWSERNDERLRKNKMGKLKDKLGSSKKKKKS